MAMTLKELWFDLPMNLPNTLTVLRILLTIIFALFTQIPGAAAAWAALFFFALAALTDLADGYIARKYGLVTVFGQIMDPIADKVLIVSAFFIFAFDGMIPGWMVVVVACREVLVTVVRVALLMSHKVIPAESAGKLKAACQMTAVTMALLYRVGLECAGTQALVKDHAALLLGVINGVMIAAVVLTLWSGGVFFKNFFSKEVHGK